ncbi:uncharacterized protein PFL1_05729 [Pseudozyma flocculosa PF-1]|uniref:(2E,6E)-farnesyl diphosphate synthase n=2 Tax=Pseudozyma flocculosa TaxID=84751 RepID=A0A5C3FB58_9BASI|nr:uncharacterized protein PFL1_05729 [Pseudozyma flocculosa PF-1]EPQ26750.1 hypothetical protein PFL1_05729 [Pseudozyma flocculosa PF-1]SPO40925.1 related to farnesyltranstransferase (al-3) [Pseudozyma flocculosa]
MSPSSRSSADSRYASVSASASASASATASASASQAGPSMANLSQTPATNSGGNAAWYDGMLNRLASQPHWPPDKESAVLEPYSYLDAKPGKEVRSELIEAFNVWLQVPNDKLAVIRSVVRMLHTASLLMDDVEDNSDLRRGIPVAHKIYGVPQTINTANYVYFLAFSEIFQMTTAGFHPGAPPTASPSSIERLVVDELINLHRGQGMDLLWRDSLICPTEEEYVEMVNNKTGGLFRIAIKLMISQSPTFSRILSPSASGSTDADVPDLLPLVNLIGLLFQIRDDFMNLQSSKYAENKGFCEDLTEGKFSFPIIHSIRASAGVNAAASTSTTAAGTRAPVHVQGPLDPHGAVQSGPSTSVTLDAGSTTPPIRATAPAAPVSSSGQATSPASAPFGQGNRQILNVLKQRPTDLATKQYAVSYMRNVTNSFDYTREVLKKLDVQARQEVARIENAMQDQTGGGRNPRLVAILEALRGGWYDVAADD